MTLNDIIIEALAQLDRGHEAQTLDVWRTKFTRFANEAVLDIAQTIGLKRQDPATVEGGKINTAELPRACLKILKVEQDGRLVPFLQSGTQEVILAKGHDGEALVTYHWAPNTLSSPTDTPELPEYAHGLIVNYVVGRERSTSDPSMQRGATVFFEIYNEGKRKLKQNLGELDSYRIYNKW